MGRQHQWLIQTCLHITEHNCQQVYNQSYQTSCSCSECSSNLTDNSFTLSVCPLILAALSDVSSAWSSFSLNTSAAWSIAVSISYITHSSNDTHTQRETLVSIVYLSYITHSSNDTYTWRPWCLLCTSATLHTAAMTHTHRETLVSIVYISYITYSSNDTHTHTHTHRPWCLLCTSAT